MPNQKFYQMPIKDRLAFLKLPQELQKELENTALSAEIANNLTENQISEIEIPLGLCFLRLAGKEYHVPMATEEPSVIAAANNGAKLAGNFQILANKRLMTGQIILYNVQDYSVVEQQIKQHESEIFTVAEVAYPSIYQRGGGLKTMDIGRIAQNEFFSLDFYFDTCDAMGANIINTILEAIARKLQEWLPQAKVLFSILSNDTIYCETKVTCHIPLEKIGQETAEKIVKASEYAQIDPIRAATHNKGILNGVEAVVLATGNDSRAVSAAIFSHYGRESWSRWTIEDQALIGTLTLPLPIATAGGATHVLPKARIAHELLGNPDAKELATLIAAVGLANNLAALKALVGSGIQKGHMSLQARSLALSAGAKNEEIVELTKALQAAPKMNLATAKELLQKIKKQANQ